MAQIYLFGDSITYGAWDQKGGWASRLRQYLDLKNPHEHYIYNLGIPIDETSNELVKRMDSELEARQGSKKENIIIISIGVNDAQIILKTNMTKTPIEKFKSNIKEIIDIAKRYSAKIIFVGTIPFNQDLLDPIPWVPQRAYRIEQNILFDDTIKTVCAKENVHYIYMQDLNMIDDLSDGIHPTDTGHKKIFKKIIEYLEENVL